jgi:general secretion pathway protein K
MSRRLPPSRRRAAFALMTVLWCIGIMTVTVLGLVSYVSLQLDEGISRGRDFRARNLALSGLALGLHPLVSRDDPLLSGKTGPEEGYAVTVEGEGGRLNLNVLLAAHRSDVLERLWIGWGLASDEAQALDDCLADWIDPGDLKRLNGAKREQYAKLGHPEYPPGRPFQSLDELPAVIGFAKVEKLKPDWRDFLTLWSDGRIDLNEAPADLIAAASGAGLPQAQAFVQRRDPAGRKGDPDGYHPKSLDEARSLLGMSEIDFRQASPILAVKSSVWRVESTGTVGDHRHIVTVVSPRTGADPVYYLWQEH